jgi:hypothetical protein
MTKTILIKYPTRGRADLFVKRIADWKLKAKDMSRLKFIVTCDKDDRSMNNEWIQSFCKTMNIEINYHDSNTKISACNKDIPESGWDYLVLLSDDMECRCEGWDNVIEEIFTQSGKGVIWFDDGLNHSIDTFCVVTLEYYNKFKYLYYPEYISVFCDNEFTEVAMLLGELVQGNPSIVKHNWVGLELKDETHIRNETNENYKKDGELFKARRLNGYFLNG